MPEATDTLFVLSLVHDTGESEASLPSELRDAGANSPLARPGTCIFPRTRFKVTPVRITVR